MDASDFARKGSASVGVAAQYCGSQGKTANCLQTKFKARVLAGTGIRVA